MFAWKALTGKTILAAAVSVKKPAGPKALPETPAPKPVPAVPVK